jgi:predicted dehydrogenase
VTTHDSVTAGALAIETPRYRAAIVGCSNQGPSPHHARGIMLDPRVELVGVADQNRARADAFAAEHGGGCPAYRSLTGLLKAQEVDLVFVCVPDEYHAEVTIEALTDGKAHVLCEKPPASNPDEVRRMVQTAEAEERLLYWGFLYFHMIHSVWPILTEEKLGEVPLAVGKWDRRRGAPTWRPGGKHPLWDLGCHELPILLRAMGNPRPLRVSGKAWRSVGKLAKVNLIGPARPVETPDMCHAVIDLSDEVGSRIVMTASYMGNVPVIEAAQIDILGSTRGLSVPLVAGNRDPREAIPTLNWEEDGLLFSAEIDRPLPRTVEEGFNAQVAHFLDCIEGRGEVFVTGEQAITVQQILQAFDESVASGGEFVSLAD